MEDDFAVRETNVNLKAARQDGFFTDFDDSERGFYTMYGKLFQMLEEEEIKAAQTQLLLEAKLKDTQREYLTSRAARKPCLFGTENSSKADVMRFYERFAGFTTVKSFAFADQYSSEGENSRVRSLVQRENERYR